MQEKQFSLTLFKFLGLNENGDNTVDFQTGESPRMENFEITDGYKLKKRDGYRVFCTLPGRVRALWQGNLLGKHFFLAVAGRGVYKVTEEKYIQVGEVSDESDVTFVSFGGNLYLGDGSSWQRFSPGVSRFFTPAYYRPTLTVATPPSGGGTFLESMNLLTGMCAQRFSPDGKSVDFHLANSGIESLDFIRIDGEDIALESYRVDLARGVVSFYNPPAEGSDNLYIAYTVSREEDDNVNGCPYAVTFGGDNDSRLFFWGNKAHPDHLWWSGIPAEGEGLYVPADCYNRIGNGQPITTLTRHYDRLLIFTPYASYYLYAEQKYDPVGNLYTAFPVFTLSVKRGNFHRGVGILMDNHPLSVDAAGFYRWVSTYQRDERNAQHFSSRVQNTLGLSDTASGLYFDRDSKGELWCVLEDKVLIYHYRLDVFYLYRGFVPTTLLEADGQLWFGNARGEVCRFGDCPNDDGRAIEAIWESAYLHFGYPAKKKHIDSFDLLLRTDTFTEADLTWLSDSREEGGLPIRLDGATFDFAYIDFSALCLDTNVNTLRFSRRIGAKRVNVFKFRLSNNSPQSRLEPVSILINGTLLCK